MKPIFIWRVVCCSGIVLLLDPERGNKATSLGSCLNLIKTQSSQMFNQHKFRAVVKKKRSFYGQADRKQM